MSRIQVGSIVSIPGEDNFALAKVIFASDHFKDVILLKLYQISFVDLDSAELPSLEDIEYRLVYTCKPHKRFGWRVVGCEEVDENEKALSHRIVAGNVYIRDELIGPASPEDLTQLPEMVVAGLGGMRARVTKLAAPEKPLPVNAHKYFSELEISRSDESGGVPDPELTVHINGPMLPLHREQLLENPLNDLMAELSLGHVSGGGSLIDARGEILSCDISVSMQSIDDASLQKFIEICRDLPFPCGSRIADSNDSTVANLGSLKGIACYFTAKKLNAGQADVDFTEIYEDIAAAYNNSGGIVSYWNGEKEVAIYLYGKSVKVVTKFLNSYMRDKNLNLPCRVTEV